jgi:hypothetical protein
MGADGGDLTPVPLADREISPQVTMVMEPGGRAFEAPDRTLMRVLWKEIYEARCYDAPNHH